MKRPERIKYRNGIYGDMAFIKQLNKYCSYLENKNQALQLLQTDVVGRSEQLKNAEQEGYKKGWEEGSQYGYGAAHE